MRLLTLLLAWKGIEAADELFKVANQPLPIKYSTGR